MATSELIWNPLIVLFFAVLLANMALADGLTCQYKEIVDSGINISKIYDRNDVEILNPVGFEKTILPPQSIGGYCTGVIKVQNNLDITLYMNVNYRILTDYNGVRQSPFDNSSQVQVEPHNYTKIVGSIGTSSYCDVIILDPEYQSSFQYTAKWVPKLIEVCKQCEGKNCSNDGDSCLSSSQCGSNNCKDDICMPMGICANDELKCPDDYRCVQKSSLEINSKPICRLEECKTNYVEKGVCQKSPQQILLEESERELQLTKQKNEELVKLLYALGFILGIGVLGAIYYIKSKHDEYERKRHHEQIMKDKEKEKIIAETEREKQRQMTLQEETKNNQTKLWRKNEDLMRAEKEEEELKNKKNKSKQDLEEIVRLKALKAQLLQEVQDIENMIDTKWKNLQPFPDKHASNRLVIINPYLGGYECFYKEGLDLKDYPTKELVHRWVWQTHNGRKPRPGYDIHHIDEDKYNNDPRNLEEIEHNEHYSDFHGPYRNR